MATFSAMLDYKEEIATTMHFIDSSKIDAGRIIATTKLKVDYLKSYLYNVLALYPQGVSEIVSSVHQLDSGAMLQTQAMDISAGHYFSFLNQTNLDQFFAQGNEFINYQELSAIVEQYKPYQQ